MSERVGALGVDIRDRAGLEPSARKFALALICLTLFPLAFFGLLCGSVNGDVADMPVAKAVWLIGGAHVWTTGLLWFDRRYQHHIQSRPVYFYAYPAAITVVCAIGVEVFGAVGLHMFMAFYTAWLFYHFGRQNWGLLCLIGTAVKAERPSNMEQRICRWAPIAGMAGALISSDATGGLAVARHMGFAATLVVAAVALIVAGRQLADGTHPLKASMTALAGLFFLPTYFFGTLGVIAVGVAHAYQYELVMSCMTANRRASATRLWMLPLILVTVVYIVAYVVIIDIDWGALGRPVQVIWYATIIWHFIIDADVWRLSRPFQRQVVRDSLPYLFR